MFGVDSGRAGVTVTINNLLNSPYVVTCSRNKVGSDVSRS